MQSGIAKRFPLPGLANLDFFITLCGSASTTAILNIFHLARTNVLTFECEALCAMLKHENPQNKILGFIRNSNLNTPPVFLA